MKGPNGRIFPLLGDVPRSPHIVKKVVGVPGELGMVEFQQRGWKRAHHGLRRRRCHPWSLSPSNGASSRCGNRALMVGSRLGDVVVRRELKRPDHRSRMGTSTLCSVPFSLMMNCSLLPFRPSNPTMPFTWLTKLRSSLSARGLSAC